MQVRITKIFEFAASHFLRNYEGKCKRNHGHNYKLEVTVGCNRDELDHLGMVIDFGELKEIVKNSILARWDHYCLNDYQEFEEKNPTAENMAVFCFEVLKDVIRKKTEGRVKLLKVRVWETSTSFAEVEE